MTAKYATTCAICSRAIVPGSEIARSGQRWAHLGCVSSQDVLEMSSGSGAPPPARTRRPGRATGATAEAGADADAVPEGVLQVWTDGACSGNPGPGGWAWATRDGRTGSGGEAATTNQRMEIRAALEAVRTLTGPLMVVSDSTYVVNCFRDGWWKGWLARGWVNSAKKPVANRDLWEPLITAVRDREEVTFRWVKGHSGDEMNDLVDRLAVEAGRAVATG